MNSDERSAQEILATIEACYKPTHDYVDVDARSFSHLDLSFYERSTQRLIVKNFKKIGDIEDKTLANSPNNELMPVMIRSLVSSDGSIMASMYHARIRPLWLRFLLWMMRSSVGRVIDMETEFSDGSFVVTSNAVSAAAIDSPALIDVKYLPFETDLDEVYHQHLNRIKDRLRKNTGLSMKKVISRKELEASQNRGNALKAAFRGEIGMVSKEELERLSWNHQGTDDVHSAIKDELKKRKT